MIKQSHELVYFVFGFSIYIMGPRNYNSSSSRSNLHSSREHRRRGSNCSCRIRNFRNNRAASSGGTIDYELQMNQPIFGTPQYRKICSIITDLFKEKTKNMNLGGPSLELWTLKSLIYSKSIRKMNKTKQSHERTN